MLRISSSVIVLATSLVGLAACAKAGELAVVGFDVPAVVVAEQMDPALVHAPTTGGKLVRLKIPVSTFLSAEFRGSVQEYVVEFESPHQSLRVIDFWPRDEVYSEVDGLVSVEHSRQKDGDLAFNLAAAVEPFGRGTLTGNYHDKSSVQERYSRKPPMQVLTSSGTIRRGYGVFFKFRSGPLPMNEGARDIAILAEVPPGWRADLLQVTMRAAGTASAHSRDLRTLGSSQMWVTVHQEGDREAAAHTRRFVTQERTLRALAASRSEQIADKSLPTWWHKLGAAMDVVEPKIPADYMRQALFGLSGQYLEGASHRLPVDVRVAVLDFWDARQQLTELAFGSTAVLNSARSIAAN